MENNDIGLGSVSLCDRDGEKITLRISMVGDSFRIVFTSSDSEVCEAYLEDESDISNVISLLESCYNYV